MSLEALSLSVVKTRRMLYLVFATITLLVLGLIYAWSIFAKPLGAQFNDYAPLLPTVFQVSMFAFCVSAIFGAELIRRTSFKLAIIVAAIFLGAGFLLTALGAAWGVWSLFLFYGILAASGCGIAYNAIISLVSAWFPDKTGFCSGVMMMGFGLASLIFGSLANSMFSFMPWQTVFIIIAAAGVIIMVALALIVPQAPANIAQLLTGQEATEQTVVSKTSPTQSQNILSTKVFWLYCGWATLVIACGLTLIGTSAQGVEALDPSFAYGALLVGLVSTVNGIGRVINGLIFDKVGLVPVMKIGAFLSIITMVGLALSFVSHNWIIYIIAGILVAFPYSGVPVMGSAYARQRYKGADFAKNLGIANLNIASAAVINIVIVALIGSPASLTTGPIIYGILAVLAAIALVFSFAFGKAYRTDLKRIKEELS
jgi:OFA family oxalate/formate antiporter-like MFS transporter